MNYLLKSKPKHESRAKILIILGLFVFFSLFGWLFPSFTRGVSFAMAKPLWSAGSFAMAPFSSIKNYFVTKNSLVADNLALTEELDALKLKSIDHDLLVKENEELKKQLGRNLSSNLVISRVLSKPPRSPYDTLVIDVGQLHNISVGDKVYLSENIIIGTVKEVTERMSLVELFSSGDSEQESTLLRTGATFTVVGRGGANFEVEVPKDTDVLLDDVFIYQGFSSSVLGAVVYIDDSSKGSFKKVYLKVPGNVFQTQWVYVGEK